MNARRILVLPLFVVLVVALFLEVGTLAQAKSRTNVHPHRPPATPVTPVGGPPGSPAIPVSPGQTLTAGEVRAYVTTHQSYGPTVGGVAPQVVTLKELTPAQVKSSLRVTVPNPVFYVVLYGPFIIEEPEPGPIAPVDTVYEVFDAKTGNLLWGGGCMNGCLN